ncbi:hypothetical protein MANES_01G173566v8 [Manihot esculenta]|uniref:Uncharacterized protein n=2 Tax=Manihot esculenta TaxID=3983 RepID=A0ACB7IE86_MANES|nr:hypothetical protein MANES_01G173566v8 [Manihot esculenta]KAG8663055.1 hypothetical protein MANES_01G173566v8 [Manihot esculenta]
MNKRNEMRTMTEYDLRQFENDDFVSIFEQCTPLDLRDYLDLSSTPIDYTFLESTSVPEFLQEKVPPDLAFSFTEYIQEKAQVRNPTHEHVQENRVPLLPAPPQPIHVEVEPMPKRHRGRTRSKPPKESQPQLVIDVPSWLPDGWTVKKWVRRNGASAGHVDKYYVSPDGRQFRSKKEVVKYLDDMQANKHKEILGLKRDKHK